jgi:hypothetical protein
MIILIDFMSLLLATYTCMHSHISNNVFLFWIAMSMVMFSFILPYVFLKLIDTKKNAITMQNH